MKSCAKTEKGLGRKELRTVYVTSDVSRQPGGREWPALACSGAIKSCFESKKGITEEWHYYISGKKLSAEELLHHARMEWSVETMHRLLDVQYRENHCRVLNKNIWKNLNMTRKLAINIVKIHKRGA